MSHGLVISLLLRIRNENASDRGPKTTRATSKISMKVSNFLISFIIDWPQGLIVNGFWPLGVVLGCALVMTRQSLLQVP